MQKLLMMIFGLLTLGLIGFIAMAIQSQTRPTTLGLEHGKLRPCPSFPNCVCSEAANHTDPKHAITPIPLHVDTWARLKKIIIKQGGVIHQDNGHYLHATFTSALFQFVDDMELRLDKKAGVIHIRSASRVGRSDLGANRQRVERIVSDIEGV